MEPIIINENLEKQNDEIRKINSFCSKFNEILPEFKNETGYELNFNDFISLLHSQEPNELINQVNEHMMQGVKDVGLTRKTFTQNTKEFIYGFSEKLKRFYSLNHSDYLHSLSMENGLLILPKENENEIRSSFIDAITTEKGMQLFELHKEAARVLNELFQFLKKHRAAPIAPRSIEEITEGIILNQEAGEVELLKNMGYDRATRELK